ncbi:MAG: VirB4 family type IV secretion system protein [Marinicella sp.]
MSKAIQNLLPFYGFENNCLLSYAKDFPSMVAVFELSLHDKDNLSIDDKYLVADSLKTVFESLPDQLVVQQYFVKYRAGDVSMELVGESNTDNLIKDHINHVNSKVAYQSKLVWALSCYSDALKDTSVFDMIKSIFSFFSKKKSFTELKKSFTETDHINLIETSLKGNYVSFLNLLNRFSSQIISTEDFFVCRQLDKNEVSNFLAFLVSFDTQYLNNSPLKCETGLSLDIPTPEIFKVDIDNSSSLQFNGAKPVFVGAGSIIRFVGKTKPDFWTFSKVDILAIDGEFLAFTCFKPYTSLQRLTTFSTAKIKAEQVEYNPVKRLIESRNSNASGVVNDLQKSNPHLYKKLQQLNEAKEHEIVYGNGAFSIFPFSKRASALAEVKTKIETAVIAGSGRLVWESAGLMAAFHSIIPSNHNHCARFLKINTHQYGALSLCYTQNLGQKDIGVIGKDEPLLFLETETHERFAFSPYAGQQSLMLGIGSTRSGKTFMKNFIASMMLKWGGKVSFLDIDKGSYPVANHFDDQSAIFELPKYNYNPFDDWVKGVNDYMFIEHMVTLLDMVASEPFSNEEKLEIEIWSSRLLEMPAEKHTFTYLVNLLPKAIVAKIIRFVDGVNQHFFTSVSSSFARINCFNLEHVYQLKSLSEVAYYTLLNQVVTDFKHRTPAHLPKFLFVDEAHTPLKSKAFQDVVDNLSRTGNKYLIGLGFFTQDVAELGALDFWSSLRTAVATLLFTSNPEMDRDNYKTTFKLSEKELDHIEALAPRREVYLIQREAGISKRLTFSPSAYYLKNFTSNPVEIEQNQHEVMA